MAWAAQSLQFALFAPPDGRAPDALATWLSIFGSPPQKYEQENPGTPRHRAIAQGTLKQRNFTVVATMDRLDIVLSPPDLGPAPTPPVFPDVFEALKILENLALKFAGGRSGTRLALVSNFTEFVENQGAANLRVSELVNGAPIPTDATDVSFQLNVRKLDHATGQTINRLCRWQTQFVQMFQFQIGVSDPAKSVFAEAHLASLMTDVNTVPTNVPLKSSEAVAIVGSIFEETRNILTSGYSYVVG